MFTLLLVIILGIGLALFAGQNPQTVVLNFAQYHFVDIPLYAIIAGSLFLGIFISWIISLFKTFLIALTLRKKNEKLRHAEKDKSELIKQVHKLQLEKEHLKGNDIVDERSL